MDFTILGTHEDIRMPGWGTRWWTRLVRLPDSNTPPKAVDIQAVERFSNSYPKIGPFIPCLNRLFVEC